MYTSVRAHLENGQVVFDEPFHIANGSGLIVTVLPAVSTQHSSNDLLSALLNGPTITEAEYETFVEQRKEWNTTRISK